MEKRPWRLHRIVLPTLALLGFGCRFDSQVSKEATAGMRLIQAGTFQMGQAGIAEPIHAVSVSAFYMDTNLVTQEEYSARMGRNPSHFTGRPNLPVETVTWFNAVLYCNARGKARGLDTVYTYTGVTESPGLGCKALSDLKIHYERKGYRLPTEAEYEFAARAGSESKFFWGDTMDGDHAWYFANSDHATQPVGRLKPNAWGLHDMIGNVWEWCGDWYGPYPTNAVNPANATDPANAKVGTSPQTDPTGPVTGTFRVLRGGSWYIYYLITLQSGFRYYLVPAPNFKPPLDYFGFRCVLSAR